MNVTETTRTFLEFFAERGHQVIPGGSLVPPGGGPVLFTTSGMHPLTPYLDGQPHPQGRRLASLQRCLRTTDLDEVGDERHLTVFQMLGSWSLGDYDGPQSLRWGYELITESLGTERGRLHATVFGGDGQVGPDIAAAAHLGRAGRTGRAARRTTTGGRTARLARAAPTPSCSPGPVTGRRRAPPTPTNAGWSCGTT